MEEMVLASQQYFSTRLKTLISFSSHMVTERNENEKKATGIPHPFFVADIGKYCIEFLVKESGTRTMA